MIAFCQMISECLEFGLRHPGLILVLFGVVGEGIEIIPDCFFKPFHKKHESKLKFIGFVSWSVLAFGLVIELMEASNLDNKVSELNLKASVAYQRATTNELTVKLLESTNLGLRTELAKLEAAVQWRTITPTQEATITNFLMPVIALNPRLKKSEIFLCTDSGDIEAMRYTQQIGRVLKESGFSSVTQSAGWSMPSSTNGWDNLSDFEIPTGIGLAIKNRNKYPSFVDLIYEAFVAADMRPARNEGGIFLTEDNLVINVWSKPQKQ